MSYKKVSIIIPYYKGEKTIFNTINSVLESIKLSDKKLRHEILVFIDSMEDKEIIYRKLMNTYYDKIKLISNNENLGVANTRNKACYIADGDYLLFLDQDDELDKRYFSVIEKYINNQYDLLVTNGFVKNCINNKLVSIYYFNPKINKNNILESNKIITPGQVLFSKKLIANSNLFEQCSQTFKGADDWAAYINLFIKKGEIKIKYIHEKIFYYNLHENNYSNNWEELNNSAIKTAEYFKEIVNEKEKKILEKRILILEFENKYKSNKNLKFIIKNFNGFIKYYLFKVKDINRVLSIFNKKIVRF